VPVERVAECRQRCAKLRERQRQHALDLRRVDGYAGAAQALAQQFLDEQAAERMAG
jgi:hypothetical protein